MVDREPDPQAYRERWHAGVARPMRCRPDRGRVMISVSLWVVKPVLGGFQFRAQFLVIVNLAIEDHRDGPVFIEYVFDQPPPPSGSPSTDPLVYFLGDATVRRCAVPFDNSAH